MSHLSHLVWRRADGWTVEPPRLLIPIHHAQHRQTKPGLSLVSLTSCQGPSVPHQHDPSSPHSPSLYHYLSVSLSSVRPFPNRCECNLQCDLGRPACERCIKYGVQCPGYRDQQALIFRDANPASLKKRPKRPPQEADSGQNESTSDAVLGLLKTPAKPTKRRNRAKDLIFDIEIPTFGGLTYPGGFRIDEVCPICPTISEHWTSQSVPIMLNVYSSLNVVDNAYRQQLKDGPLLWAAHLFSRTYVTNLRFPTANRRNSVGENQQELRTLLGKTLRAVSLALKTRDGPKRDDILVTVWVLANYEVRGAS